METADDFVTLGRVCRAHGISGALLIAAFTKDPRFILDCHTLEFRSPDGRNHRLIKSFTGYCVARGLIIRVDNINSREMAQTFRGWLLGIVRRHLPTPGEDEIYWADLLGLNVLTIQGRLLGRVAGFMDAGAGLLLVVPDPFEEGRERLLPFQEEFLNALDLPGGRLIFDLPPGFLEL